MHTDVFQQHLTSKAHMASAKRHGISEDQLKQLDRVVPAYTVRPRAAEGTETHAQRIERFQQVLFLDTLVCCVHAKPQGMCCCG